MNELEQKYEKLFKKLDSLNEKDDNESSHILQDKIYRKFIKDICNNKLTTSEDIKKMANKMYKNVVKNDKDRWYG
jgi:hypothetical protein